MVLIYRTVPTPPTGVVQVPPDTPLEETFTSFTCELAIMLAAALVTTHHTLDILILIVILRTPRLATIRPGSGALLQLPQTRADTRGHE